MTEHFYSVARRIDSLVAGPADQAAFSRLPSLIDRDASLKAYFFSDLHNVDWFHLLNNAGYFSPNEAPEPQENRDDPGYFSIPEWPVLPYLVQVSEHAARTNNSALIADLLKIIHDVTVPPHGAPPTDNPRTWWYFVKILIALPNIAVSTEALSLIPTWLTSEYHMTLVDSDICRGLLPKFLAESAVDVDDYKKATIILEGITTLTDHTTDVDPNGHGSGRGRLKLLADDYWLSEVLVGKKLARQIGRLCSTNAVMMVADRLFDATSYRFTEDPICAPLGSEPERRWFKIECDELLMFRLSVFDSDPLEVASEPLQAETSGCPLHTADSFKEFLDSVQIQDPLSAQLLQDEDPTRLFFRLFRSSSHVWIKSFDNRFSNYESDAEGALTLILLEMLLGRAEAQDAAILGSTGSIIDQLLFGKYRPAIFTRIALYVIGRHWDKFYSHFWNLMDKPYSAYYFDDIEYEAELYSILEDQSIAGGFPDDRLKRLVDIVEDGPAMRDTSENQTALWMQAWYSTLKSIEELAPRYQELLAKTQTEEDLYFRRSYVRVGHGESPLTLDELLSMSNHNIAAFCAGFRNNYHRRDPTVNALADVLGAAAQENPGKFVDDLDPFRESSYLFVYKLLTGLRETWKNRKTFDWELLLAFVRVYMDTRQFRNNELITPDDDWRATNQWIVGEVAWLLQDATVDDDWAMPEECHPAAEEILRSIVANHSETSLDDDLRSDPVNNTLNSTYGRVLTAIIYLSLRVARLESDSDEEGSAMRWPVSLKALFTQTVESSTPHSYVLIGQYLPQFLYLDRVWTEAHRDDFVKLPDDMWYLFMYGYMFGNRQYATYYSEMIPHYERGMDQTEVEENWEKLFLDHLALGFMGSIPQFGLTNEGFIGKLAHIGQHKKLCRIVEVIYRHPRHDGEVASIDRTSPGDKFLELWRLIDEKLKMEVGLGVPSADAKALLSELCKLTVWMPELTEEYCEWLMWAAPYANTRHNSVQFVEYLDYVSGRGNTTIEERAKYLAHIYLKMMQGYVPYHKEEHIQTIVSRIYESNEPETIDMANQIVDKYARSGFHFLRDIWDENNPTESPGSEAHST
jgi:hypothetical protein